MLRGSVRTWPLTNSESGNGIVLVLPAKDFRDLKTSGVEELA